MVSRKYTLDDCAAYDYPAAINKVIEVTQQVYSNILLGFIFKKGTLRVFIENFGKNY